MNLRQASDVPGDHSYQDTRVPHVADVSEHIKKHQHPLHYARACTHKHMQTHLREIKIHVNKFNKTNLYLVTLLSLKEMLTEQF